MCPRKCANHIYNDLTEKMMDELGLIFFLEHHYWESIRIFMWELNKVHYMSMQFVGDKENKGVVQNRLKYFINGNLYTACTLSTFPLYS